MQQRQRFEPLLSLTERLDDEVARLRAQAELSPYGAGRDRLAREARQAETASHVDGWLSSSGLRAPR